MAWIERLRDCACSDWLALDGIIRRWFAEAAVICRSGDGLQRRR
jgi:hypothetical protein